MSLWLPTPLRRLLCLSLLILLFAVGGSFTEGLFSTPAAAQPARRTPAKKRPAITLAPRPVRVIGTLAVASGVPSLTAAVLPSGPQIALPDAKVSLRNAAGRTVSTAVTQLDGKFHLAASRPGSYTVCWNAGKIGSGCTAAFNAPAGTTHFRIVPVKASPGTVRGKVLTADGRPCWVSDPFFALDVATKVSLLDSHKNSVQGPIRANVMGEYIFGAVEAGRYVVQAACEKAQTATAVSVGGSAVTADLTLPNHAPQLEGIAAFDSGKGIARAVAGSTVQVAASVRDRDADAVEYLWRTLDGSLNGGNAPQQDWTLGPAEALQNVYLMARDGKGGYTFKRFSMMAGGKDLAFSGRVVDEVTQQPVAGATVSVNGKSGSTNPQGWFSLRVPPSAASPERYVLNVEHPQYALLSRVLDNESTGNTYELIRAQTTAVDPTQVIDLVDTRSSGPCGGKDDVYGAKTLRELRAGSRPRTQEKPCRHRGAHIVIPAGSLVEADQSAVSGGASMAFATLNPSRRALPGDYRAIDRTNQPVEMLSFGAAYAAFRDSGGRPLNLKAGTTAEVRVPVSDEQRPSAAPTIAMWSYDQQQGLWVEEGQASLQNTAEGWMYVGSTKHFSTLNMDVAGNDPAQATCVRFELGPSLAGWTNLVLRAYVSYAGTSVQVKETPLNSDQYHAIYRIPYAPPAPPPNTLRLELRGTYGGQQVVLLNNIIATDAPRPKMTGTNLWPPYPYAECGAVITLNADPVNLPQYGDIDATGRPAFLTGPFGQFLPANGEQIATDYYNTLDPGDATNPTLSDWWSHHGFNAADGSGGTSAQYLNFNDLGFGRDMNCINTGPGGADLACYVTNYGLPDQNLANADAAATHDPARRGATVAMEYIAAEPADRRVRFYVYAPGPPNAAHKLKFADLDGLGPKPVPHLCIVCHGGEYDAGANNVTQARFREFDLPSFKYSGGRSWDFAPSPNTLTAAELTAFASLNQKVHAIAPATSPIRDLIAAWYTGGFGAGTAPAKPAVPSGWSGQVNGYHNVYAKSCRTCHVARDGGVANNFITFNTSANFAGTSFAVCGTPKIMPNAFVTYKNFWNDLQRVIDYKALTGAGTCQ